MHKGGVNVSTRHKMTYRLFNKTVGIYFDYLLKSVDNFLTLVVND